MKKILSRLLVSVFVLATAVISSQPALAQTSDLSLLKEDLAEVARYMQEYKSWLAETKANGYGELGFTYNTAPIDRIVQDCNRLYRLNNVQQTTDCLEKWDVEVTKFDATIQQRLLTLDKNYLNTTLTTSFVTDIEGWMKENEEAGYSFDEYKVAWPKLKARLFAIKASWQSNPARSQEMLYAWYDDYDKWTMDSVAHLEKQYASIQKELEQGGEEKLQKFQDVKESLESQ